MAEPFDPLAFMEQMQQFVASMTGVKQQFIDSGWNERNAERAAIAMLEAASAQNKRA
jgi:nuclear transport factor 2 (NTF2) superfamily protein